MVPFFRPTRIVAIDAGADSLKAVALNSSMRGVEIAGVGQVPLQGGKIGGEPDWSDSLRELMAGDLFPAEWVVFGLRSDAVSVRSLSLPRFRKQNGEALVKYELESLLPYQAEDMVVSYFSRPTDENNYRLLAMAVRKSVVAHCLGSLAEVKLDPRRVGWSALGAYEALSFSSLYPKEGISCLLDMGEDATSLVLFDTRGPLLVRAIDWGRRDVDNALPPPEGADPQKTGGAGVEGGSFGEARSRESLNSSFDGLVREVEASLISCKTGIDRMFITGGVSTLSGLEAFFRQKFNVECVRFNALEHTPNRLSSSVRQQGPAYTAAIGMALTTARSNSSTVDFLKEEFAPKRPLQLLKGKLVTAGVLVAVIAAVMGADIYLDLRHKEQLFADLKTDARAIFTRTFPQVKTIVSEERQMAASIEEAKKGLASVAASREGGAMLDLIEVISQQIPLQSNVRVTELTLADQELVLVGEAPSFEAVNQLKDRISAHAPFGQAVVEGANANQFSKVIEFSIKVERK